MSVTLEENTSFKILHLRAKIVAEPKILSTGGNILYLH